MTNFEIQEGGKHYLKYAIQPTEFIHANGLGFIQGNVIKYICRYKDKGGKLDLLKARHYINLLIEKEYGEEEKRGSDFARYNYGGTD